MVLQRNEPVAVWGKAVPGKTVEVFFGTSSRSAIAAKDSSWMVYLPKQKANAQPQTLRIKSADSTIVFSDILVGDVWLCIGQSNMEWPMKREMHYKEELPLSGQPLLRFYNPSYAGKNIFAAAFTDSVVQRLNYSNFYEGKWQQCDSESFKTMSAVAYYFGKAIAAELTVPIGLINLSIGGAPLETFIDPEALQQSKQFAAKVKGNWLQNASLPVWTKQRGEQNVGGSTAVPADEQGKNHGYKPGFAYKAGIEPILHFAIKGILNYQGESNAQEKERVEEYAALSALMMNSYRRKWKKNLPYYFVQLSSIDSIQYKGQLWPQFRNEQRRLLSLISNSGMAVSSDYGAANDVHPTNKKVIGERLARWALHKEDKRKPVPSGPLPLKAKYINGQVIISFQYTGAGLQTADGKPLRGFSLNGITESIAAVQNKTVVIRVKEKPLYIYYAWKPFTEANLVNSEQLPASTFKLYVE